MNEVLITKEILENAGFEYMEQESKLCAEYEKNTYDFGGAALCGHRFCAGEAPAVGSADGPQPLSAA